MTATETRPDPSSLWPELVGSPRQVKWATAIRQRVFDAFRTEVPSKPVGKPVLLDYAQQFAGILGTQTSAAWWIEYGDSVSDPLAGDWATMVAGPFARQRLLDAVFE